MSLICECNRMDCDKAVPMSDEDYLRYCMSRNPLGVRFVTVPEHRSPNSTIVHEGPGWVVADMEDEPS